MNKKSSQLLLCVIVSHCMQMVCANSSPVDLANQESIRIQQMMQERQRYEQEQLLQSQKAPARIEITQPEQSVKTKTTCINIKRILVENAVHISSDKINFVTKTYEKQCIDVAMIETLMGKITALYLNKGYATSRVYLPEQDLSTGTLILKVQEGVLKDLKLTDHAKNTMSITTAISPWSKEKILNLRDLEQALDQINRLQSNSATMEIMPGENAGESIVIFDNKPSNRLNGYLSHDNKGQSSTGEYQVSAGVGLDNPFGLNDLLSLSYNRTVPFKNNHTDSASASVMYVVPFGYHTWNINASRSDYDTTLKTQFNALHSSGTTSQISGKWDYLLHRDLNTQFRLNAGLTSKDTEAFLEDVKLGVSSRKLSVLDFGFNYSDLLFTGLVNINTTYSKGLKIFDALRDETSLPDNAPKAQFDKLSYGISYSKPFNWHGQSMSFSTSFSGQQALDTLYGSEQYSIGSLYNVKGFNQNTLSGDSGYAFKNNLGINKNFNFNGTQIFTRHTLGLDYGRVFNKEEPSSVGELSSVSFTSTLNANPVALEFIVTQPISQPSFMKKQTAEYFFSTTISF